MPVRTLSRPDRAQAASAAALRAAATCYLGITLALLGACLVLVARGWHPWVVASDSMSPALRRGDVVFTLAAGAAVRVGDVVVARDPAVPGQLLNHRVIATDTHGVVVTKGDANTAPDSSPVPAALVLGRVAGVVPYVGLVSVWRDRNPAAAVALTASLLGAVWLARPRDLPRSAS